MEKEIDYNVIKQIKEHAKKYDLAFDKKEFLKNVSAYEQKVILLESKSPCEVLTYLDELDLKSTKLVLRELTIDEISKILELFTTEDKKRFYNTFSELSVVNEFIMFDKNSSEYINELPLERKIELIDSSNEKTSEATSKVYESMTSEEKTVAVNSITSVDAISALNNSSEYNRDQTSGELNVSEDKKTEVNEVEKQELTEEIDKEIQEQEELEEKEDQKVEEQEQKDKEKQEPKEMVPEEKEVQLQVPSIENADEIEFYEKYSIIGDGSSTVSLVCHPKANSLFNQSKEICEQAELDKIKQNIEQQIENDSPMIK